MRSRLALLVVPALLLALLPGAAAAGGGPGDDISSVAARERARVIAYWTPARIAAAQPRDVTFDPVRGFSAEPQAKPSKPGGGGGGGGSTNPTITGASYTGGGAMLTGTGRVLFTIGGDDYICSGSVVRDAAASRSIVMTAGHCTMENDGSTWATNWMYIPSFDTSPTYSCADSTYGCWVATELYGDSEFLGAGGFNNQAVQHDWAFAVVGLGGKDGTTSLESLGTFPLATSGTSKGQYLSAFGYPAAGAYAPGDDLVYCAGSIGTDRWTGNTTWKMGCDMTGGSSGGPWVSGTSYATGADIELRSLNSYGYSGQKSMYGPMFNAETLDAFRSAESGTLRSGVVRTQALGDGF